MQYEDDTEYTFSEKSTFIINAQEQKQKRNYGNFFFEGFSFKLQADKKFYTFWKYWYA